MMKKENYQIWKKEYRKKNRDKLNQQHNKYRATIGGWAIETIAHCRERAICNITKEDLTNLIKLQPHCQLCYDKLFIRGGRHNPNTVSIDRIIPELGYINGNIRLLCRWCNTAKHEWSDELLIQKCKSILNHQEAEYGTMASC